MRAAIGVLAFIAIVIVLGCLGIYSGVYDIAADQTHSKVATWVLSTTMERSVARHAKQVSAPGKFTDEQIRDGLGDYHAMCEPCHGAPGKEDSEVRQGLNPRPPNLARSVRRWNAAEIFWIVKHGVRMTGMPAFGPTHDDEELWNIVAFVEQLPKVSAEQYAQAAQELGESQESHRH